MNQTLLRRLTLAGASLAALAAAAPALAQASDEVEALVVTAPNYVPQGSVATSKAGIALIENPESISVISRDQIDLLGWTNLGQVARYSAGVTGENYGSDERYDWLTVRGFNPVQYVDGLQSSIGSISNTGLDVYGAESVEILKGPASFLYGSAPPGGIVNVTMRRPQAAFGGEAGLQVGSYDHWQVNADITGEITPGFSGRLTGLYRDRGTQVDGVESTRTFVAPAAAIELGPKTSLTLLSYYQDDEVKGDGRGFLPAEGTLLPNPNGKIGSSTNLGETSYNRFARTHWGLGFELKHAFANGVTFEQNAKISDIDSDERGIYGNGFADAAKRIVNRSSFSFAEKIQTIAADSRVSGTFETGAISHNLLLGFDFRDYEYEGRNAFPAAPPIDAYAPVYGLPIVAPALKLFSDYQETQAGLYVQDQIRIGDGFIVTLGGRYDWVSTDDYLADTTRDQKEGSYRAGLTYVFDNGIAPYVSLAKSFQPTAGSDASGKLFEPTTGEQVEAGVKWDGRNLPDGVKLFATAAVYQIVQQNVLAENPSNVFTKIQVGEVEVKGFEVETVARFDERLSVNLSYSWTDSEVTKGTIELGAELPMTPEHKASALVDYTFQDGPLAGLGGSLGVRYTSSSAGNIPAWYAADVMTNPSVTLWDASLHYDRADWRLALTASNLFDEEYVARCQSMANCFYGTRRVVVGSLTRRF